MFSLSGNPVFVDPEQLKLHVYKSVRPFPLLEISYKILPVTVQINNIF